MSSPQHTDQRSRQFRSRMLSTVAVVTTVIVIVLLVRQIAQVLLLLFAGVLFGVLLTSLAHAIAKRTPLAYKWALGAAVLLVLAIIVGMGWIVGPQLSRQLTQLQEQLPQAIEQARSSISSMPWGKQLLEQVPQPEQVLSGSGGGLQQLGRLFGGFSQILTGIILVLFTGFYLAASPATYRHGVVRLIPKRHRERATTILSTLGYNLRRWLLGQMVSMVVIGTLTTLGLWLLGAPLPLVLGLTAGLLEFIPTFGPVIALVPAVLLALLEGPTMALKVFLLYNTIQFFESYFLQPFVQKRAVEIPPVLTLFSVVIMTTLFGFMGAFLGTPLMAVILVLVKMIYIEDVLGDREIEVLGEEEVST